MASGAIHALGTFLQIGDAATPTEGFTTIAEVNDLGGPSLTLETIDVTSHDSSNGWREFIGGLLDGGEVSFTINYIPTNATHNNTSGLIADLRNRVVRNFQLVFPDGGSTTWVFAALVTSFEPSEAIDSQITADVTLKVSGAPTLV
jgi:predicted secreted protein